MSTWFDEANGRLRKQSESNARRAATVESGVNLCAHARRECAGSNPAVGASFNGANAGADRRGEAKRVRFTSSGGPVTVGACRSVDGGSNPHARMPEISAGRSTFPTPPAAP